MKLEEAEYRLLLLDAMLILSRIVRFYRSRVLYTCNEIEASKWSSVSAFAELTNEHAQRILDESDTRRSRDLTLDLELPLPRIRDALAEKIEARRANSLDSKNARHQLRPGVS